MYVTSNQIIRAYAIVILCITLFGANSAFAINVKLSLNDLYIEDFQHQLIDLAFESASLIPVKPHIKDRSRKQEEVILACIELGLPNKALGFIPQIENWREGQKI